MPERATVTCFCGQTGLTFANPLPRNHSECLCVDCRQKLEWACGQAGRPWTPTISNLWYIDDDVVATKGEEHLQEFVLRCSGEGTPVVPGTETEVVSPFVVATCCHSVLCVPAIYYNSNYVAVIEQGCRLQCQPCTPKIRCEPSDACRSVGAGAMTGGAVWVAQTRWTSGRRPSGGRSHGTRGTAWC